MVRHIAQLSLVEEAADKRLKVAVLFPHRSTGNLSASPSQNKVVISCFCWASVLVKRKVYKGPSASNGYSQLQLGYQTDYSSIYIDFCMERAKKV